MLCNKSSGTGREATDSMEVLLMGGEGWDSAAMADDFPQVGDSRFFEGHDVAYLLEANLVVIVLVRNLRSTNETIS